MCEARIASKISEAVKGCYVFEIYVIPKRRRARLEFKDDELIFYSSETCKRHKVNMQLLHYLKERVRASKVSIVEGPKIA